MPTPTSCALAIACKAVAPARRRHLAASGRPQAGASRRDRGGRTSCLASARPRLRDPSALANAGEGTPASCSRRPRTPDRHEQSAGVTAVAVEACRLRKPKASSVNENSASRASRSRLPARALPVTIALPLKRRGSACTGVRPRGDELSDVLPSPVHPAYAGTACGQTLATATLRWARFTQPGMCSPVSCFDAKSSPVVKSWNERQRAGRG